MNRCRVILLVFLPHVVSLQCAADVFPLEQWKAWNRDTSSRYPGETWLQYATAEDAGWSSEKLGKARKCFDAMDSAAVLVIYDGAVLAAWGKVETRYMCHSIRKSLLSALYGIHVSQGNIDLQSTLAELGIDDEPPLTDREKRARVVDLLTSRSGVYHPAAYETVKMKEKRPERGSHEPGEVFWYNNWDFNALCTIFERQTRTRVFEEFQRQFARPLKMEDFRLQDTYYHREPEHSLHPAYPFRMSARDMARIGLLFLREGRWQERQVLTEQWIRESTASHFKRADTTSNSQYAYGYLWWRVVDGPFKNLKMYSARGYGGHSLDIVPLANLVFVHRVETFWDLIPPFGAERKRVEDAKRLELLDLVLRARAREPSPDPKLVPLPTLPKRAGIVGLDPRILPRYATEYDFEDFRLRVKTTDDGLTVSGSRMGEFSLLPLSETEFVMEDVGAPVVFETDEKGNVIGVTIETAPGKKLQGRPVSP